MSVDSNSDTGAGAPTEPLQIGDRAAFDEVVADHEVVLVDFYADWCGPCTMLGRRDCSSRNRRDSG